MPLSTDNLDVGNSLLQEFSLTGFVA